MSTTTLPQEDLSLLSILDQSAVTYGNQGLFYQANRCAELIVTCAPQASAGYQRLASLYMIQGKAADTIKVLDRAQDAVPKTAEGYTDIETARDKAVYQANIRVDFVAKLPADIIITIMKLIAFKDRLVCATLSEAWHQMLVHQTPGIWSDACVDASTEGELKLDILKHVFRHAKSLIMKGLRSIQMTTVFSGKNLVTANDFKNVQSLTLCDCAITYGLGLVALSRMPSLRVLSIESRGEPVFSIGDLLFICPKLKSFTHSHEQSTRWPKMATDMSLPDTLELESLAILDKTIDQNEINAIVGRSPFLRNLYLMVSNFTVLEQVKASCPSINVVIINDRRKLCLPKKHFVRTPSEDHVTTNHHNGLRTLITSGEGQVTLQDHQIMPLIEENKDTLTTLLLELWPDPFGSSRVPVLPLGTIAASHLSQVSFRKFPQNSKQAVANFIRQCPLLSLAIFEFSEILNTSEIFDALMPAQKLEKLCLYCADISNASFHNLLDYYAKLEGKSTLQTISVVNTSGINDETLRKFTSLGYLKQLRVDSCSGVSSTGLTNLVDGLTKLSYVTSLHLCNLQGLGSSLISRIGEIQSLESLTLGSPYGNSDHVTDNSIFKLLKNAPHLKSLTFQQCPKITKSIWQGFSEIETTTIKIDFK